MKPIVDSDRSHTDEDGVILEAHHGKDRSTSPDIKNVLYDPVNYVAMDTSHSGNGNQYLPTSVNILSGTRNVFKQLVDPYGNISQLGNEDHHSPNRILCTYTGSTICRLASIHRKSGKIEASMDPDTSDYGCVLLQSSRFFNSIIESKSPWDRDKPLSLPKEAISDGSAAFRVPALHVLSLPKQGIEKPT